MSNYKYWTPTGYTIDGHAGQTTTAVPDPTNGESLKAFADGAVCPGYQQWETSYTKKVCDTLKNAFPYTFEHDARMRDAYNLLKAYHLTQHEVYEQRDEAREQLEAARGECIHAVKQREELYAQVKGMRDSIRKSVLEYAAAAPGNRTVVLAALRHYGAWRLSELYPDMLPGFLMELTSRRLAAPPSSAAAILTAQLETARGQRDDALSKLDSTAIELANTRNRLAETEKRLTAITAAIESALAL
jgi:hypothetical protein